MKKLIKNIHEMDDLAREILLQVSPLLKEGSDSRATVVGLSGELGAGKTTFTQYAARALGIHESVPSPTFVVARFYDISGHAVFRRLVHVDAYRIESLDELRPLGWKALLADPRNLILVEWPEKMGDQFPKDAKKIIFEVVDDATRRIRFAE